MKFSNFQWVGACLVLLAGCTSAPATPPTAESIAEAAAEREARCLTTGSMIPKRDCRANVVVVPPSGIDQSPKMPSAGPRN